MSNPALSGPTHALIKSVLALIGLARGDPSYPQKAEAVLDLCKATLDTINVPQDVAQEAVAPAAVTTVTVVPVVTTIPPAATATPGNLALRISELAAQGRGVREIARQLGVHPSTVSRRLRGAQPANDVARNT